MRLDFTILENVVSLRLPTYGEVLIAARVQEIVQRRRKAVQRPSQTGSISSGKPSVGPIRRPAQTPVTRNQPYQTAPAAKALVCDHCSRPGHVRKDCRILLGQCLRCGSKDHMIRDCPSGRVDSTTGQQGAPNRGQARPQQQQALVKGQGRPAPKGGNAGARGQAFNLTVEEAALAEGIVEGNLQIYLICFLAFNYIPVSIHVLSHPFITFTP